MGNIYLPSLEALQGWFERQKRVLPWRENPSLYRVWISEIMLQQTQVTTVIPYFERFIARFPTVQTLAVAPEQDVLTHWAGLGYYSRARNLQKAAARIVANGFPMDREGWLAMPGVGPYTAGAILSIALDQPEAILDGNVERVVARVRCVGARPAKRAENQSTNEPFAREVIKRRYWRMSRLWIRDAFKLGLRPSQFNQALMELGATVCTPRNPRCVECPLSSLCKAYHRGKVTEYPQKGKAKQWIDRREESIALINARGEICLEQQSAGKWRAGLWDLPSRPAGAASPSILKTVVREHGEVEVRYVVTRHKVRRRVQVLEVTESGASIDGLWNAAEVGAMLGDPAGQSSVRWVRLDSPELPLGSAARKSLQAVGARLVK